MYTTAFTLALFVWTKDLLVAETASINTYVAEDGRSYYSTALYCSYSSLYLTSYYNKIRSTYVITKDRDLCYLSDSRNKCCLQTDSRGIYQGCKCDPSITFSVATTTEATKTATVPTTTPATTIISATAAEPTTTSATTAEPTATSATTAEPTRTTTASPKGCLPTPLCRSPAFRVLNGDSVASDCPNSGVFKITLPGVTTSSCNAVYTLATVNGVFKPTILTADICKQFIELLGTSDSAFEIHISSQKYKILQPDFSVLSGPNGTAFIDVAQSQSHILDEVGACQKSTRCAYNQNYMQDRVNFKRCQILSWGVSNADKLSQNGLNEVALEINNGGCQDIADRTVKDTLCFKTASGKNLICSNDSGAPVYCKAFDTEEWVLMGVTGTQSECDHTPEVTVLPYPG